MAKLTVDLTLSQGPWVPPPGPSHPLRRTPQILRPSGSGDNLGEFQGGVVRTRPRAPATIGTREPTWSGVRTSYPALLRPRDAGPLGDGVRSSPVKARSVPAPEPPKAA